MEQWHYDPAVDLDQTLLARLRGFPRESGLLVHGVRLLAAVLVRCWLRIYHRMTIVGRDNLPADGSFVLIANHASHLDTLCLLASLPLHRVHSAFPAAAKDYFCKSTMRSRLAAVLINALPFERRFAPWQSLSVCAHLLKKPGNILIFFPEGTRLGGPQPGEFKPGVALLAAGRDLPIVPCHLAGTGNALPKGAWCPRPKRVRLTIGAPRIYAHLPATKTSAKRIGAELREVVMLLGNQEAQKDNSMGDAASMTFGQVES